MIHKNIILETIGQRAADRIKRRIRKNMIRPESKKKDGTTLIESGNLLRSIVPVVNAARGVVIVGTNVDYARIHHEGGVIRPRKKKALKFGVGPGKWKKDNYAIRRSVKIPARPYLYLDKSDRDNIKRLVKSILKQGMK